MDKLTREQRRKTMQHIKSRDTRAELALRKELWKQGYRYRKNYRKLPGSPDIVFLKQKTAVFIDGEFWHGYSWENVREKLDTNREYWIRKIEKNMERDESNSRDLRNMGWKVLRFWSREVLKNKQECIEKIKKILEISEK